VVTERERNINTAGKEKEKEEEKGNEKQKPPIQPQEKETKQKQNVSSVVKTHHKTTPPTSSTDLQLFSGLHLASESEVLDAVQNKPFDSVQVVFPHKQ
jgi:hypothetical protein